MLWSLWCLVQVKLLIPLVGVLQVLIVIATSYYFKQDAFYPKQATVHDGQAFDFVVIGAGSAGCVIANRLTENENWKVLLIEAGDDPPYISEIPGVSVLTLPALPEWNFYTVNDGYSSQAQVTKSIHLYQGKMLGGSSSTNCMYYVRGNQADFEDWASRGNDNWNWKAVLKYFIKSERMNDKNIWNTDSASLHSDNGYLGVSRPAWPEMEEYLEAFKETGHDILYDINGYNQLGYSIPFFTIDESLRQSTAVAYIQPVKDRPNLFLLKNTVATKIVLDVHKRATGVKIKVKNKEIITVNSNKEVILSAGAICSPQLLMLSGIGPKIHLDDIGIETIVESPKVGTNFQDHMIVPIILTGKSDQNSIGKNIDVLLTTNQFVSPNIIGFVALNKSQMFPDYQVSVFPVPVGSVLPSVLSNLVFGWNENICKAITNSTYREVFYSLITYLHPKSRGQITLKTKNIDDPPIINNGFFSDKRDIFEFAKSVKDFTSIANSTLFKSLDSEIIVLENENCKDFVFDSSEYWECYVLNLAASQFHPVGTCSMGPTQDDVVDQYLKVRGVKGLRVADSSVMPTIISGNTNAAVIMIAEKVADMIKYDHCSECRINV